jgi:uncharacterized protein (DUF1684 family)
MGYRILGSMCLFMLLSSVSIGQQEAAPQYEKEIENWHEQRIKNLRSENGWLNVSGLFWLQEGDNSIGTLKSDRVRLPEGKAPATLGTIRLKSGVVTADFISDVKISVDGQPFRAGVVFDKSTAVNLTISYGSLRWFVIERNGKYGIRLRDLENEATQNFHGIDRFQVDSSWRIVATLEPAKPGSTIPVVNVLGMTTETPYAGTLNFSRNGRKFSLQATLEGQELFIVFADSTSGHETYGGGRFLYAKLPPTGNQVVIDFNKAYNPPCAFTEFATCPLPSDHNRLDLRITAGEKAYGQH